MIERASELGALTAAPPLEGNPDVVVNQADLSAGDLLRQAREAQGVHIEMMAAALKVPVQKIAALEADDIAALPDAVFARALAASVCRALHVDPAPVLAKLPGARSVGLADADQTISTRLRSGAPSAANPPNSRPSRAVLLTVCLLLAGAAAVIWLPNASFESVGQFARRWTGGAESSGMPPASIESAAAVAPGTVVEPVTAAAPALPTPAPVTFPAVPVAPVPTPDLLTFIAKSDSWITVTEPGGKPVLRRTVAAGETVNVNGTLPLTVVVGRASGIEVRVRGAAFDLAGATRAGGVARFEVKP